jgi:hypothetical protein
MNDTNGKRGNIFRNQMKINIAPDHAVSSID